MNFRHQQKPRPKQSSLIMGRQPVVESMQAGKPIERIYLQANATGEIIDQIKQLARDRQIPVNKVPAEKLNSLTTNNHQGCIALAAAIQYHELQEVISFVVDKGETPLFILLDGVTDVRNVGAIARTALCCGAQAIIVPDKGIAPLQEDAIKASAGALEQIYICRVNSLMKAVDELHLNGIKVFASDMGADKNLFDVQLEEPCAIIMGSEDKGIFPSLMKICDDQFKIPLIGNFESLNVSVATGMILYESMRQRMNQQNGSKA